MTTPVRTATPDEQTVVVSVTVRAPRGRVFRALTDAAELERWWWPERFGSTYDVDARVGGRFQVRSTSLPPGDNMGVHAEYTEVDAPSRLAMAWAWEGEPHTTQVVIELRALDEETTEVVVTHAGNPSTLDRDNHGLGWRDCLDRLEAFAAT